MKILSGLDLVNISRFDHLNPVIRKRFFQRVFTQHELNYIDDMNQRAAGIFAAKEACAKTLGCGIGPVRWVDIEIFHSDEGQPTIHLQGPAKSIAVDKKIVSWSVSITHTKETAAAVVVAAAE